MPLSDTAIRNVKPGDKARKMFDGGGLYLEKVLGFRPDYLDKLKAGAEIIPINQSA